MSGRARIWIGGVAFFAVASTLMLTWGSESATVYGANQNPTLGGIFTPAAQQGDLRTAVVVRSAYLHRSKEVGSKVTQASASPLKMQLASAVREGDLAALQQFMAYEFGKDHEADGLLIEGARKLALSGRVELVKLAESKIASYVTVERARATEADHRFGNLVQLAEAMQDFRGPVAAEAALSLLQDRSMPRVVRGAAALSLGQMDHAAAKPALVAYRNDLNEELSTLPAIAGDREFILDAIREVEDVLGRVH